MPQLIFVGLGGALGAIARYLLATHIHSLWSGALPLGTLLVNVSGSFFIGVAFVLLEKMLIHPDWRSVLVVGFLGAFTTFSTFSLETVELTMRGEVLVAALYTLASVMICIGGAAAGIWLSRLSLGA
ncbi:MAG: fluoride efflux transporter CrcB [Congregibacter sp.]